MSYRANQNPSLSQRGPTHRTKTVVRNHSGLPRGQGPPRGGPRQAPAARSRKNLAIDTFPIGLEVAVGQTNVSAKGTIRGASTPVSDASPSLLNEMRTI